jgi:molybdate transport system ATP-binding protein
MNAASLQVDLKLRRHSTAGDFLLTASFEVPLGITVVIGPSGAGKSTLLALIAGLLQPDEGRISIGGEVWLDTKQRVEVPSHKRALAMVFQNAALFPHMTALGNVEFALDRSRSRKQRREQAMALLHQMKVEHLAHRYPSHISGGEAQRVSLARALARSPRLVLLDEPFSALDRQLRLTLAAEVCEHLMALGVPVLFITHHQEEALLYGKNALLVTNGAVQFQADVSAAIAPPPPGAAAPVLVREQPGKLVGLG